MRIQPPKNRGKDRRVAKFPLSVHHGAGQYMKKIRRKQYSLGPLSDPDAALKRYMTERDDLEAGRKPCPQERQHRRHYHPGTGQPVLNLQVVVRRNP
ncbi:MAG: hypothetical protein O3C60_13555 [Planctomycetota bacterium]|nr:hypothetical protein [Planctomycetota bacterium]